MLGSSRPPILDLVLPSAAGEVTGDSELLKQLQEIPVAQRAGFVTEFLQREVQNFLRLAQPPAATSRFLDLGTDSLMAIELRNRLHSQFGGAFTINATAVFDYPTIGGLAEYLVGQLPDAESPTRRPPSRDRRRDGRESGSARSDPRRLSRPSASASDLVGQRRVQRHVAVRRRCPASASASHSMAPSSRLAAVVLPPSARVPPGTSARLTIVSCGIAVDDDAVVADALVGLRPVRRARRVDAGDVVDDDPLLAAGPADDLEPERALGALLEAAHHGVDRLLERQPLDLLGDLVDLEAEAAADEPDVAAPHHRRDRRQQHHRDLVHRAAETAATP